MIRFLSNSGVQEVDRVDPNTTVLDYLRDHQGHTGTKEGCASGDCGACTVVLASPEGEGLRYRSVNACITPLGTLHGQQLLTVTDLASEAGLHPVQQAMVDCHGSQCGFCTPGFVMSLFAHRKCHAEPEREQILESLGGNLCRCTGYRPILDAAQQMYQSPGPDQFSVREQATAEQLRALASEEASLEEAGKHYFAPTSLDTLAEIMETRPGARLVAGATDLALEITQGLASIDTLVYTGNVPQLQLVEERDGELLIGAAATYSQCRDALCKHWPALEELLARLGSLQIRNQGTVGGNIANASPIGDMPPVLLALGARLILRRGGETRSLPLEEFFLAYRKTALEPGEFIEAICVPLPAPGQQFQVYKISKRLEDDISALCGAFFLVLGEGGTVSEVRIAFGGMAAIPARARHCERALQGQPFSEQAVERAAAALSRDFSPISDFRASADYRMQVAGNLLRRLLLAQGMDADKLQVTHCA